MSIFLLDKLVCNTYNLCMNTTTVNISLPTTLYADLKKAVSKHRYTSVSELIREAVRNWLYPRTTVNGFTPEFENQVLAAAKEPLVNDRKWDGKGSFTDFVLNTPKHKK